MNSGCHMSTVGCWLVVGTKPSCVNETEGSVRSNLLSASKSLPPFPLLYLSLSYGAHTLTQTSRHREMRFPSPSHAAAGHHITAHSQLPTFPPMKYITRDWTPYTSPMSHPSPFPHILSFNFSLVRISPNYPNRANRRRRPPKRKISNRNKK